MRHLAFVPRVDSLTGGCRPQLSLNLEQSAVNGCRIQTELDGVHWTATPDFLLRSAAAIIRRSIDMLSAGKAVKVIIYLSEGATQHGIPAYSRILDFLFFRGVSGATVLKGVAGFGADHHMHSSSSVEISDHLPVKIEFVESREKVNELLGKLEDLAGSGMIEIQETTVAKPAQPSRAKKRVSAAHQKIEGKARMMRIYIGESDRWKDKPLYQALVEAMRANDIAGVTVYRGILGYGAHRRIHKDKPMRLSRDASIMLSAVDTEEKLRTFLPLVEQMVEEGLVVISNVEIIKYSHRPIDVDQDEISKSSGDASA
jgi:PII-like signaling protein